MGSIRIVKAENITKEAAAKLAKASKRNLHFQLNPTVTKTTKKQ